ncbi:double-strand break repair helicase AddA [Altererythrobacter sp. CC-YST694]|uniref:double-strand break repair helicase AddA n=1 Tax=Altererythrobacter sp. CC-YST694 TaxID=2755038 RepID=UPI001D01357F|nr:double-strand break repair helicase AddA [Altererythrobacter sp. CC-YST694]MCB5424666.1 double-strand break repair helicase AddA [Altererythrobacter sp. CC-YST694]
MSGKVYPLKGNQAHAVDPERTVWLSASAGTGKTQVLSARVLRLLLQPDVQPSEILCLTFTKAGAAEMAVRVNEVLAGWVRMPDGDLAADLKAIGADFGPDAIERARTLFASVLDCPGGGLRIDTIHAFAQWLLSAFPEEAGLTPGTRAMEDRERSLLAREVLAEMLVEAQQQGDEETLDALADLSLRKGPDAVEAWLMTCAQAREAWFGAGAWIPPFADRLNQLLGLPADASEADIVALCADDRFDTVSLRMCMTAQAGWKAKTGQDTASAIGEWLAASPGERAERLGDLQSALFTQKGEPRSLKQMLGIDPAYPDYVARVGERIAEVAQFKALLGLAKWLLSALMLGRKFALAWEDAKNREGLIDFDDQIRRASDLLHRSDLADWIRYKLDRRFDHILVDEAQDTNEAQWRIIDALTGDFFAGLGQRDGKMRTLFVVGDYKQAIFRFQGTSPENFARARDRVRKALAGAVANAREARGGGPARDLLDLGLGQSFRTAQQVLTFVDEAIAAIGHGRFGLSDEPEKHFGDDRPGLVILWQPVSSEANDAGEDEGEQSWISSAERRMAGKIARQVKAWLDQGFPLAKGRHRNAGPGDIMVLVRKRRDLAGLIVARLYAAGVPVAGVDRLRLGAPLAVKDLMAALRFAAQPLDDLNLANLLVSPLIGWSQQDLLDHGWREDGRVRLWGHLRASSDPLVRATLVQLGELLARADYEPPQALLHWILVGSWQGRRKLVARLGREANDPIDELLNAALAYASALTPSLQGFIQWFDAGEGELKREAGASSDLVRVMTVHGSKGLQAPIVILADAAGNPDTSPPRGLELEEILPGGAGRRVPLPSLSGEEKVGRIAQAEAAGAAAEREEHWRLLYVAMTRAEEALFIGGALGSREDEPAPDSWHAQLRPIFTGEPIEDPVWGRRWEIGALPPPVAGGSPAVSGEASIALPEWALRPIGPEPRPPRPLAPSSLGEDTAPMPPMPPGTMEAAARRGTLIHALLERLPELERDARAGAARQWLARRAADLDEATREEMTEAALAVLNAPDWAEIFSPSALAEVPLAATVEGRVIAGTADRLFVTANRVMVVDFKTAARPPRSLTQIPMATLRQMAAYVAALEVIYPGRVVEAAVLYTQTPELFALPAALLAEHKAHLSPAQ